MKLRYTFVLPIWAGAMLAGGAAAFAHEHLAAGANSTAAGSPLIFVNAADYGSDSGYVFALEMGDTDSAYDGWYFTGDLVLVALAATGAHGGPEPQAAAIGSHIEAVLETVEGPAGARLGFWATQQDGVDSTNLTWTVPAGLVNGTNHITISENDGSPTADPYGHVHGNLYSVDKPGLYTVGLRFVDTSTNGPRGGPIQSPSDRFYLYLQADFTIAGISVVTNEARLTFAAPSNVPEDDPDAPPTNYQFESTPVLGLAADWHPAGDVVVGDDHLHTVAVPQTNGAAFYRLKAM